MATELGAAIFLSWVRGGLAQNASPPAADAAGPRLTANVNVDVSSGGTTEPVPARFELYGPADTHGVDGSKVLRTDPKVDEPAAEPNYLCLIEFDPPELPWAVSPGLPDGNGQVQPWIALVVVPVVPGRPDPIQHQSGAPLPFLRCPAELLPKCEESWAWAHAQVVPIGQRPIADVLTDPAAGASTLSRLICPTKLEPNTRYVACVVPTFDASIRALTKEDLSGVGTRPAWGATGAVKLPVYYSWRFGTGVPGDFEEAARLLHPVMADRIPGLGRSKLSMPAEAIPGVAADDELPAVRTLLTTATEADLMETDSVREDVQVRLAEIVSPDAVPAAPPTVQPPAYGRWPAQIAHLGRETAGWIGDLNRSPAHRIIARLGGDLIRTQQEELVAEARRQAGEYARARAARDRLRLAELTSTRLFERRLAGLDQPALIATARPAHHEIALSAGGTIADGLAGSTIDPSLLGRSMARVSARAARRMNVGEVAVRREVVAGTFAGAFTPRPVATPVLTGQLDRLREVFSRAGLLDRAIGTTTLGGLIDASSLATTAGSNLVAEIETAPLAFVDAAAPVNPDVVDAVIEHAPPLDLHVLAGPDAVDEIAEPNIAVNPQIFEALHPNVIHGLQGVHAGAAVEAVEGAAFAVAANHVLRRTLDEQSALTVTGMLDAAAAPLAEVLGTPVAAVDINAFTVDDTTAELGRQFREQVSGQPSAPARVSTAALLRAKLGLQVGTPVQRASLSLEAQGVFDRAIVEMSASVLTSATAFPVATVARLAAADVAQACLTGLVPRATHTMATSRVLTRDQVAILLSPMELILGFVPVFDAPLASRLGKSLNSWILAGAGQLPANAVSLVVTNPAFIEAFTVGANHEMAAELLWRDVPSDPRGTVFKRFWNTPDISPIHRWTQPLGHNVDDGRSLVAVVIRSPLLRRYPNTVIYAAKRLSDGQPGFTPDVTTIRTVKYQGFIEPDASYSVIDLDVDEARQPAAGWFILVSQPVTDARFGLDEPQDDTPATPPDWNDLNWKHIPDHRLSPSVTPVLPQHLQSITWGASAADMAFALHQDPFRVVLPAARYLPPDQTP